MQNGIVTLIQRNKVAAACVAATVVFSTQAGATLFHEGKIWQETPKLETCTARGACIIPFTVVDAQHGSLIVEKVSCFYQFNPSNGTTVGRTTLGWMQGATFIEQQDMPAPQTLSATGSSVSAVFLADTRSMILTGKRPAVRTFINSSNVNVAFSATCSLHGTRAKVKLD